MATVDARGCFRLSGRRPVFQVSSQDEDVIGLVGEMIGATVYGPYFGYEGAPGQFQVMITGKRAVELMRVFYLHLNERRRARIEEIFEQCGEVLDGL